jgi:hypothetical protein
MSRQIIQLYLFLVVAMFSKAAAPEPLIGTWILFSQTLDNQKVDTEPITLRIYPSGNALEFAYSSPLNGIHVLNLKFTSVRLDGSEGSVQDFNNKKLGSVRVTKVSPREYKIMIEGPNRPKGIGRMIVSADSKTLTSESETSVKGVTKRALQVFNRR